MQAAAAGRHRQPLAGVRGYGITGQAESETLPRGVFGNGGGNGYGPFEEAAVAALPGGVAGAGVQGNQHMPGGGRLEDARLQFAVAGGGLPVDVFQRVGRAVIPQANEPTGVVLDAAVSPGGAQGPLPEGQHLPQVHDAGIHQQVFHVG